MKKALKGCLKWFGSITGSALTIILVIVLFPYAATLAGELLPDLSDSSIDEYVVLNEQICQSARLETQRVERDEIIIAEEPAAFIGTAAKKTLQIRYEASFGIDLSKVGFVPNGKHITFVLPAPELINDSIVETAKAVTSGSPAVMPDSEAMKAAKREELRAHYLSGDGLAELRYHSEDALNATIIEWLNQLDSRYTYTFQWADQPAQ